MVINERKLFFSLAGQIRTNPLVRNELRGLFVITAPYGGTSLTPAVPRLTSDSLNLSNQ